MRLFSICMLLVLMPLCLMAQSTGLSFDAPEVCGTEEHHLYRMQTDPDYKARFEQYKADFRAARNAAQPASRTSGALYTIPVVVHIIHVGESIGAGSNMSEAAIYDAIQGLNDRYANDNGMGEDMEINFCLANRDPNGCPSSGIIRVDGRSVPNYESEGVAYADGCGASELEVKALSFWPVTSYYNIWVVHSICGGNIAGYAYYPNGDWYDGTIINVASMNYGSRTLAHELGHGLNIQHTFSGDDGGSECPEDNDCTDDGDEICDTPPHRRNDCGINNPCGSNGEDWDDSRYNWMSYCTTAPELGRFTAEQRERMHVAINEEPRFSLLNSEACANEVSMRITNDDALMCSGEVRELSAVPEGGSFLVVNGPGEITGNVLTSTGGGSIVIGYEVSQPGCTSTVYQVIESKQTPSSRIMTSSDSVCIGLPVKLTGSPSGGTFSVLSGPGVIEESDLIAIGEGPIEVRYTKTIIGCVSQDDTIVTAFQASEVTTEFLTDDALIAVPDTGVFQWIDCDQQFEAVAGATDAIFIASTSGNYAVVMTSGVCSDTSDCVEVIATATHDPFSTAALRFYPNPVTETFFLESLNGDAIRKVVLSDMNGKIITSAHFEGQTKMSFTMRGMAPGMYLLVVERDQGEEIHYYRVVKI